MKKVTKMIMAVAAWLVIWEAVSLIVGNQILVAGPIETLITLVRMASGELFWISIGRSLVRMILGIVVGILLGTVLAYLSYKRDIVRTFLSPMYHAMKSVPVASFIILFLIWCGSQNISMIVSCIVVFPIIYANVLSGLDHVDPKMIEMAVVFRMPGRARIKYIFMPQLAGYLKSAISLSVGMGLKSGVAAEVIGQPLNTIGNGLYNAKIYLETGELFAWTIAIVVLCQVIELICRFLLSKALGKEEAANDN